MEAGLVVCMPDLFRGAPWRGESRPQGQGSESYEAWRETHPAARVDGDVAAALRHLRHAMSCDTVSLVGQ